VALTLAWGGAAGADPDELAASLAKARRWVKKDLRYADAIVRLEAVLANHELSATQRVEANELLAYAAVAIGDPAHAEQAFSALLDHDPTYRLPTGTSPKVAEIFERTRAHRTPPPPPAQVRTATATRPEGLALISGQRTASASCRPARGLVSEVVALDDHRCGSGRRRICGDRAQPPERRAPRDLRPHLRALIPALLWGVAGCSSPASIVLRLSSELLIPTEADTLVVSVYSGAEAVRQESYLLGTPPRDRWPQTLPLISEGRLATVGVGAELRHTAQGGAPLIVGYGSLEVSFPSSGSKEVELTIARSCSGPPAPGCPDRPDAGPLDAAAQQAAATSVLKLPSCA
jgi:hypothetical protein